MASLKELKDRIESVKSTQKITKAKKMVAAAKLRRAQQAAEAARPYAEQMEKVMSSLASKVSIDENSSKLLAGTGKLETHLLVVATSDRGLCGAFNANIVKEAKVKAEKLLKEGHKVLFYTIGRKGVPILKRAYPDKMLEHFDTTNVKTPGFEEAKAIAAELTALIDDGKYDVAHLFYGKFKSALVQEPTVQQIIPIPVQEGAVSEAEGAVDYEPDEEEILAELLPRNLTTQIFGALLENMASEQGASMTAMDNATRNAGDLIDNLTIVYNRSRQAAITTELIEIIAGAEAL
ncbi:F-type H+-transporting ATPase subunit gamma [Parasphingorhabdus marina DSM 22363]|uniref:ATP synthase gamma chain n=1 Tax=Parasphingorhabdus marina DSM 22363 TaxID=1123272 RepID=A0A1N6GQG8_9SPHN|nr:F0F1 ATP synthase subunit gamma [Parasphingorhabdus marina]SIO09760.1 F-type H+-transporting ATPase subunit gamma [Parasphingorhabdus marina DSM 22363]